MDINIDLLESLEIEQTVLSSAFTKEGILFIKDRGVNVEDFYSSVHQDIFKAVLNTYEVNGNIDLLLVAENLKVTGNLKKIGGLNYLSKVVGEFYTLNNLEHHIKLLKDYKLKRDIMMLANEIQNNTSLNANELLQLTEDKILSIQKTTDTGKSQDDLLTEYITEKESIYRGDVVDEGTLKTGLYKLDDHIKGFSGAELITIFAFSAVGKTAVSAQIALNMKKQKVMYFSLEMTYKQLMNRLVANQTGIPHEKIKYQTHMSLSENEMTKILDSSVRIASHIKIHDTRNLNDIISKIQIAKLQNEVDIVFVDYVGLVEVADTSTELEKITQVTRKLKALANTLNIPIVILAQAKQSAAHRQNNKAYEKLNDDDLADSASIFRDSDTVLGIYRNTILDDPATRKDSDIHIDYNSADATVNPECINILVRKCRNATKKTLAFMWNGETFRIMNRA